MSKTWRKHGGWKDSCTDAKIRANRKVRRTVDVPNGREFKKLFCSWNISDWSFISSVEKERYDFHHPLTNWACMCDPFPYGRGWTNYPIAAPEPIFQDGNWTLPKDYGFSRNWRHGVQRVNPETGDYEWLIRTTVWEYVGSKPGTWSEEYETRPFTPYYWVTGRRIDWREKTVESWEVNPNPKVVKWVQTPYFTEADIRNHVEQREEMTRNYRKKVRYPRYWRRDRKRARRMKITSRQEV